MQRANSQISSFKISFMYLPHESLVFMTVEAKPDLMSFSWLHTSVCSLKLQIFFFWIISVLSHALPIV